jgi:hypothetical protein
MERFQEDLNFQAKGTANFTRNITNHNLRIGTFHELYLGRTGNARPERIMRKVCPQCQGTFDAQFLCPNCGVEMIDVPDRSAVISARPEEDMLRRSRGTARRLLAGVILGQGLYYGFRQLGTAFLLAGGDASWWSSGSGQLAAPCLQLFAVLFGGMISGAGNARGTVAGAAVGLVNAVLFLAAQFFLHSRPPETQLMAGWLVCIVIASLGALVGRWVWPALEDLPEIAPKKVKKAKAKKASLPTPIAWFRILGGAMLSVGCTVWAGPIRDFLIGSGSGVFAVQSHLQSQFVAWVISALAMIVGGAFAGASSHGGLRHGFLVGLLASAGIFVIHIQVVHEVLPAEHFFYALIQMAPSDTPTTTRTALFLLTNTLLLGTLGGVFGAALWPRMPDAPQTSADRGAI